jgi:hypothetical protein
MQTLTRTLAALILLATVAFASAQSAEYIARKTGNSVAVVKKFMNEGFVFDPSDNSLAMSGSVGKPIPKHTGPRYIYTYSGSDVYRFIDQNGEIHFVKSYGQRYDPATRRVWFLTANGNWGEI